MGRELKRVALDFSWPLSVPWKGFINPYNSIECSICDRTGLNPETLQIDRDWYDFENTGNRWCNSITQDEVDALIENGRLWDFTHKFISGQGWRELEPAPIVTAEMVNEWNSGRGLGHDAINQMICVRARATRLGVYGLCPFCEGSGVIWFNENIKQLSNDFYEKERYGPPEGEGWQLWETVSEGSPVTPVFASKEALTDYLVQYGDAADQRRKHGGWDRKCAEEFLLVGWAPTIISGDPKG